VKPKQSIRPSAPNVTTALVTFLSGTLAQRRERYVEFAGKAKTQRKLIAEFYHHFAGCLAKQAIVPALPEDAWELPAYSYGPSAEFGTPWPSLKAAYESMGEATLLVTQDGRFGIHTQEDSFGGPIFIQLRQAAGR
jgi:hypothetical protein